MKCRFARCLCTQQSGVWGRVGATCMGALMRPLPMVVAARNDHMGICHPGQTRVSEGETESQGENQRERESERESRRESETQAERGHGPIIVLAMERVRRYGEFSLINSGISNRACRNTRVNRGRTTSASAIQSTRTCHRESSVLTTYWSEST